MSPFIIVAVIIGGIWVFIGGFFAGRAYSEIRTFLAEHRLLTDRYNESVRLAEKARAEATEAVARYKKAQKHWIEKDTAQ